MERQILSSGRMLDERLRNYDWAASPFGPAESWSPTLRTAVSLCASTGIPTAIYWGPELRLIYNEAWAPIAGERHPWAFGRPAAEVWADIWPIIEPQMRQVQEKGEGLNLADQMLPMQRGGRVQHTHWDYSFTPLVDEETGAVVGIFNQGNETTGRLNAERALRASEQRLEYALGAADTVGTWDWDVPADRVTADSRFARIYGVDPARAKEGAPIGEFFKGIHPGDLAATRTAIETALRTGEVFSGEYRLVQPDGTIRWVAASGRCTLAPDGTALRFPGVSFDITERVLAREALRESESRFEAIVDSIDHMVWSTRPDGFHDFFNQRWYDFTGVPEGSTDGESWAGIFHPDDQDRAWAVWRHCLETGDTYRIEYRLRHRSGQYRWVLGRAQPQRDETGAIRRWFGTCTDIQDIVDAREVLARSREELEAAVRERTAALLQAEEQLRQAQKMEAVGQLTGGIAHDFNNMLAVILGGLSLLERRLAKGETDVSRYIEAARDGATRAASLTQRLLAFSRRQPLAPEVIDANRMIAGLNEFLDRSLGEHVITQTVLAAGLWKAHADPSQLEQSVLNLAVNARDAMPDGGRLTIETANAHLSDDYAREHAVAAGHYVLIAVTDTGEGMSEEVIAKAFDPFFTTKPVGKGTGLGLSQVFGFVRQSGGHVKIYSEVGQGTSIKIYLPRYWGEDRPSEAREAARAVPGGLAGETILVVEDDDRVRNYSVEALRELGYTVIQASRGPEALALLAAHPEVTLLFTDVVMPGMTGRELATLVHAQRPELKVLFTTGYTRNAIVHNGVLDAGTQLLQKPFSIEQLATKVRDVIDG